MEVILIALISAVLSAALNYVNNILNSIVPIALHAEQYMTTLLGGSGFGQTFDVMFNFGISLIVLKFLKRAFDSYVLWQDGDPDADPINLVTKFLRAIVIAASFPTLYEWMTNATEDMTNQILNSLSGSLSDSFANSVMAMASLNLFNAIVSLVFFICFFFLYIQFLMRGMEILILRMGVPIACTGLMENDKVDKYPTIKDLYDLLNENCKNEALHEDERENYRHLACLLENAAIGQDSFLWNNQTSIKPHSKWICLDTHALQNSSEKVIKTQYFNILTWAWEKMSRDRTERVLLVCDEAYLMIDNKVPQSLVFLRNCAKRARKYEAGLMIIPRSVVDFLDPSIKMYGQALKELSDLYNLTEAEKELLLAKKRAVALFCCGAKRLSIKFDLQHKLKYISGGGR